MASHTNATPLATLLAKFEQRRPLRAGSLIVTVFGDAIAPRGGSLWLGSLLDIMSLFGIEAGLVRTALSRLVQEGWFERTRAGKNSFYRLSPEGAEKFAQATRRIYHAQEPQWDGTLQLALLTARDTKERTAARDTLASQGFGQAAANLMLRPQTGHLSEPPAIPDVVWLTARIDGDGEASRLVGATSWQLDGVAASYARFIDTFSRLVGKRTGSDWDDAQAFRLRIVLLHEYRRVILRDPLLPRALLPADWPGTEARALCRKLYKLTVLRSERWLDAHGSAQGGSLPPLDDTFRTRFEAD